MCNFVTSMVPTAATFVSYDPISLTYTVDASQVVLPTDLGPHMFTIKIDSLEYGGTVMTELSDFIVDIICTVNTLDIISQPAATTYMIRTGPIESLPIITQQNNPCDLIGKTLTHTYVLDGIP